MRSDTVYISGRVTGLPREEAERNFKRGEDMCRNNAFNCINPLDHVSPGASSIDAIIDCIGLMKGCDSILLLNDHKFSEGSKIEEAVARYGGMRIFHEEDLT